MDTNSFDKKPLQLEPLVDIQDPQWVFVSPFHDWVNDVFHDEDVVGALSMRYVCGVEVVDEQPNLREVYDQYMWPHPLNRENVSVLVRNYQEKMDAKFTAHNPKGRVEIFAVTLKELNHQARQKKKHDASMLATQQQQNKRKKKTQIRPFR